MDFAIAHKDWTLKFGGGSVMLLGLHDVGGDLVCMQD